MADAVRIEFAPGMTAELYDQINARVNPPSGAPDGLMFHSAGLSPDGGWRIIDVWDSGATFEAFLASKVMPVMAELIGPEALAQGPPPTIEIWPLHNVELHGS